MFRIEVVGSYDPQVLDLSNRDTAALMNGRTRVHCRAPGFISALRMYGEFINYAITTQKLYIDDPEVQAYFEICRLFHAGGSITFHNEPTN